MNDDAFRQYLNSLPVEARAKIVERFYQRRLEMKKYPARYVVPLLSQKEFFLKIPLFNKILYRGGNRSGKTFGGAYVDTCYLTGEDPAGLCGGFQFPAPKRRFGNLELTTLVWAGSETRAKGVSRVERKVIPLLPPDTFNWSTNTGVLTMMNGAQLKVMSYDMPATAWTADEVDLIDLDEECPPSFYQECLARISSRDGKIINTVTPLSGHSNWTYWEFIENIDNKSDVSYVDAAMDDNFYLTDAQKKLLHEAYDNSDNAQARLYGIHMLAEGMVHKQFGLRHIIEPFEIDAERMMKEGWRFGYIIDLHGNHDEVFNLIMFKPAGSDSRFVAIDEMYYPSGDMQGFAAAVKKMWAKYNIPRFSLKIIDTHETSPNKDGQERKDPTMVMMLHRHGVDGHFPSNRTIRAGISAFNDYLIAPDGFRIFSTCKNTIKSIRMFQYASWRGPARDLNDLKEDVVKKDIDEIRNLHYAVLEMPAVNRSKDVERAWDNKKRLGVIYNRNHRSDENEFKTSG